MHSIIFIIFFASFNKMLGFFSYLFWCFPNFSWLKLFYTNLPCLTVWLHLDKPTVNWKYSKSKLCLIYLTYQTSQLSFSSVHFSCSVLSDSLLPHESQHTRPPCPSPPQTHIHWVSDAIQPSHPLSSPSPPAPNPSQHQSLFQWVNSSHEVAKVLEFQL